MLVAHACALPDPATLVGRHHAPPQMHAVLRILFRTDGCIEHGVLPVPAPRFRYRYETEEDPRTNLALIQRVDFSVVFPWCGFPRDARVLDVVVRCPVGVLDEFRQFLDSVDQPSKEPKTIYRVIKKA